MSEDIRLTLMSGGCPTFKICYNEYDGKLNVFRSEQSPVGKPSIGRDRYFNVGSYDDKSKQKMLSKCKQQEIHYDEKVKQHVAMANEQKVILDQKFVDKLVTILYHIEALKELQTLTDRKRKRKNIPDVYEVCNVVDVSYLNNTVTTTRQLSDKEKADVEYHTGLTSPEYIITLTQLSLHFNYLSDK
jgi:hypothetical protein